MLASHAVRTAAAVVLAVPPLTPLHVVHPFAPVGRYAAGDRGVDLAGFAGEVVVSATAGTVAFAGVVAGQGVVSVLVGDGRRLTYEPVAPSVRAGQRVSPGSPLGHLAGTHAGCPAAACLHWGLRTATGSYADPLSLLGPPRVRLLPLVGSPGPPVAAGLPPPGEPGATGARPEGTGVPGTALVRVCVVGLLAGECLRRIALRRPGMSRRRITLRPRRDLRA